MKVTVGKGGGDVVNGVTGLCRTFAAVTVTETHLTPRILSGLTSKKKHNKRQEVRPEGTHRFKY